MMRKSRAKKIAYNRQMIFGRHDPRFWTDLLDNDLICLEDITDSEGERHYVFSANGEEFELWKYLGEDTVCLYDPQNIRTDTLFIDLSIPLKMRLLNTLQTQAKQRDNAHQAMLTEMREMSAFRRQQIFTR